MKKLNAYILTIIISFTLVSGNANAQISLNSENGEVIRSSLREVLETKQDEEEIAVIIRYEALPVLEQLNEIRQNGRGFKVLSLIDGIAVTLPKRVVERLPRDNRILSIETDQILNLTLDQSTKQVQSKEAVENYSVSGKGVKVAILDTGINSEHEALKGRVIAQKDFTGEGAADQNGHGTHVACIVGCDDEKYRGNAPEVSLLNAKVMDKNGNGSMSATIEGLNWAIQNKADIINLSVGAMIAKCDGTDALSVAVDKAVDAGSLVVVSAGNNGPFAGTINTPGCAKKALTVGAVNDFGNMAYFSSRGPTSDGRVKPEILAPGVNITSAWYDGGFATVSGTSQASPHVAGIAALLKQVNPDLAPEEIKNILQETSAELIQRYVNTQDQGIINALSAVKTVDSDIEDSGSDQNSNNNEDPDSNQESDSGDTSANTDNSEEEKVKESRQELVVCLKDAKSSWSEKTSCLKTFLKTQKNYQLQKLSGAEQIGNQNLNSQVQRLKENIKNVGEAMKNKLSELIELSEEFVFADKWGEELEVEAAKLNELMESGQDFNQEMNVLSQKLVLAREFSVDEKFDRGLIPFLDTDSIHWYLSYVEDVKYLGCVSGYKDSNGLNTGYFGPADSLTVAESLKIILECSPYKTTDISTANSKFEKAAGHWAEKYFIKAEELGLSIAENDAKELDPNRPITRAEFVREILEVFSVVPSEDFEAFFVDVPSDHAYSKWIYEAFSKGIISGDSTENLFRPEEPINRAEASKVMIESLTAI